jgi:glycosyltransferase involved in cell wall biosynthesis
MDNPVNNAKPLVSAIIPTYNHADCLSHAIDSILAQEGRGEQFEVEVIVADDASTDATAEVVRRYPQVRYLRLSHRQGVSAAQNAGIRAGTGQYLSILGADDTWLPHKLRVQVALLRANPDYAVVYGQSIRRGVGEDRLFPDPSRALSGRVFEAMLTDSFASSFAAMLIRREAFDKAGYFDEQLASYEDYDVSLRLAFHFQFLFEPGPVTIYNISPNGLWLTQTASGQAERDYRRVIEKALQLLPDSARAIEVREELPIRSALQPISPLVLVGAHAQAWIELMKVLREYPSCVRHQWVRNRIKWVTRERLLKASAPLSEARELCAQIRIATENGQPQERHYRRWLLAEIWVDILATKALRSRLGLRGAAYAAIRAFTYAPLRPNWPRRVARGWLRGQQSRVRKT